MASHPSSSTAKAKPLWFKAILAGLFVTLATYAAALACAVAQIHSAVKILAWPTILLTRILPSGEPVTTGSPENPWPILASLALAWLVYSVVSLFFLRRGLQSASA